MGDPRGAEEFDPGAAPSPQSVRVARWARRTILPVASRLPAGRAGIAFARAFTRPSRLTLQLPRGIVAEPVVTEVDGHPLSGEWIRPADGGDREAAVLYLHGSGFVTCSPEFLRPITGQLAKLTGLPLFVPRYRLAPEHPFPAAADDAWAAHRWLVAHGIAPERIPLAGDSAGGHLAIGVAGDANRAGIPPAPGVLLISPLVDMSWELAMAQGARVPDPLFTAAMARRLTGLYFGQADAADPRLAILDGDLSTFPPCLIQAGGLEVLSADATALAERLRAAGRKVELQIWPGQIHDFQLFHRIVPEARRALRLAARFLSGCLDPARIPAPTTT